MNRDKKKNMFFRDLKKNISNSVHTIITLEHIQQIMFLKEDAYRLFWEKNSAINDKYDIMISLPVPTEEKKSKDFTG